MLVALLLLSSTGCSGIIDKIWPRRPPLEQYRLVITAPGAEPASRRGALPGAVAIAPYVTRGIYAEPNIAFRVDGVRFGTYPSREWAIPLRHMLGEATETILKAYPLTAEPAAFDPRAARSYEYQWRGTVLEFEEVNRGSDVLAAVHLEAELVRTANDSVVWRGAERMERPVPAPANAMPRVVETLSAVTAEVITLLLERARSGVAVPTAAAAPPPP